MWSKWQAVWENPRFGFISTLSGTVLVAICCFTPALVVLLTAIGLGGLAGYLDYVLWPALLGMGLLTLISYRRYQLIPPPQS